MSDVDAPLDATDQLVLTPDASRDLEWIELDGEVIVWNNQTAELHRLDPIATLIFHRCNGSTALADVVSDLVGMFDADRHTVEDDVVGCVRALLSTGLLSGHHAVQR